MRRAWRVAAAVGCMLGAGMAYAGVAQAAAGDPTLMPALISAPVPGWSALPAAQISQGDQAIQSELSKDGFGGSAKVAMGGWTSADQSGELVVLVVAAGKGGSWPDPADFAKSFTSSACTSAGGTSTPASAPSSLPNANAITCNVSGQNTALYLVGWSSANHAGAMESTGLSQSRVEVLAQQQEVKLAAAFPASSSSSTAKMAGEVGGVLVVVLVVVGVVILVRRRRTRMPAGYGGVVSRAEMESHVGGWQPGGVPASGEVWRSGGAPATGAAAGAVWHAGQPAPVPGPMVVPPPVPAVDQSHAPGWYPSPEDPGRRAWWDGATWSNYQAWDGASWRDL